jgi:uncharacterized membrane protein YoaK (UPF0700 family)
VFPASQSGNVAFLGLSIGGTSPAPGWAPPVAIAAFMAGAAVAMGLQTDVIRRGAGDAVSTTYLSGAIARIGEAIGMPAGNRERESELRLLGVLSLLLSHPRPVRRGRRRGPPCFFLLVGPPSSAKLASPVIRR